MTLALLANRGLHKRPGGWSPKELGTLSLWLDADDATTITISTGVSQWDDKSGNARHATQGTGANQPAWTKSGQNGRAVVRFDGSNDYLSCGDVLDLLTGGISIGAAFKASATSQAVISKTNSAPTSNGEWHLLCDQPRLTLGGTTITQSITNTTNATQLAWVLDRSASSTVWRNGTQAAQHTTSPLPNTTSYDISDALLIGGRNGSTTPETPLNGDVYEIVASLAVWSTEDRQKIEGYLAHKWGLTSNLPSNHPYKNAAP